MAYGPPCPHCGSTTNWTSPFAFTTEERCECGWPQNTSTAAIDPKGAAGKAKAQLHLCPPVALVEMSKALKLGADKYGERNWVGVKVKQSTYISAILRHLGAMQDGEDIDPESGAHHLGHIMANCAIMLDAKTAGTLEDDRVLPHGKV